MARKKTEKRPVDKKGYIKKNTAILTPYAFFKDNKKVVITAESKSQAIYKFNAIK